MIHPDIVCTILFDVEVTPKAVRSESIRAVRVILGRPEPTETDACVPPCYPARLWSHPTEGGAPD